MKLVVERTNHLLLITTTKGRVLAWFATNESSTGAWCYSPRVLKSAVFLSLLKLFGKTRVFNRSGEVILDEDSL